MGFLRCLSFTQSMAEIELSVLAREYLISTLARCIFLWEQERNSELVKVDWRFTTQNARRI